jgi:hypothetical protein
MLLRQYRLHFCSGMCLTEEGGVGKTNSFENNHRQQGLNIWE